MSQQFVSPLHINIQEETRENPYYRRVIYTSSHSQLVLMNIPPGGDIEKEVHPGDQFIRIETGFGKAVLNGVSYELKEGFALTIPARTVHQIFNVGNVDLKLYTLYSPPEHSATQVDEWDYQQQQPITVVP